MPVYNDFPFYEAVEQAEELIKKGVMVHQKFTCAGCGQRLTIEEPNRFYTTGTCDKCSHVTDIRARGCNYLLIASRSKTQHGEKL